MFRLGLESWQCLSAAVSPWSAASAWPVLSHRLWSVLDADKLGAISFRHVVTVLGILCSGDVTAKLKLLFCLHLPGVVLPGELEDKGGSCVLRFYNSSKHVSYKLLSSGRPIDDSPEVAADATDFFIPECETETEAQTATMSMVREWLVSGPDTAASSPGPDCGAGDVGGETKVELRKVELQTNVR